MSPNHRARTEGGQVLIIFAAALLVLMAIGALVVDLGFAFMIRRQEQNAADPGAIAAARFIKASGGITAMRDAACFYAHMNGFFGGPSSTASCVPANDPAGTSLTVNYPPSAGAGTFAGRTDMVEVVITRNHQSFLGGIVGLSLIPVSSSAVAAFSDGVSNTSSLIALDPTNTCATGRIHGTGDITIAPLVPGTAGGYVHVNSTCGGVTADNFCGNPSQGALVLDGSGNLTAPHTYVSGTCKSNGDQPGPLTEGAVQIGDPLAELPPPRISDYPTGRCGVGGPLSSAGPGCDFSGSGVVHLEPGVYYGTSSKPAWDIKGTVTLELGPGVYILAGGGIKLGTGGSITSVQGSTGAPVPVLIFNTDNPSTGTGQSNIDFNATGSLKLRAIDSGPYRGIVVWNDGNGSNPDALIDLKGQATLDIAGTIYSPKGLVNLEGGSGGTSSYAAIQIIAWHFDVGGNADLLMPYDPNGLYQFPQKGLVR